MLLILLSSFALNKTSIHCIAILTIEIMQVLDSKTQEHKAQYEIGKVYVFMQSAAVS